MVMTSNVLIIVVGRGVTFFQAFHAVTQLSFTPSTHGPLAGHRKTVGSSGLDTNILQDRHLPGSGIQGPEGALEAIEATAHWR